MKLKEILDNAKKVFYSPEVIIEKGKKEHIIRSYSNNQYLFTENTVGNVPLVKPDLESLRKEIEENLENNSNVENVTLHIKEFGHTYQSTNSYDIDSLLKRINKEQEDITKIVIRLD